MMNIVNDEKLNIEKTILYHKEGVDLIPANIELSAIEVSLVNAMSRELILRSMVDRLREFYDYIIIDCMLSLGMMTINALACADSVLIPVQAAYLPVKGLQQLIKTIETKMDMEKIMAYVEKIAENLEGLVCAIGCDSMPSDGAICVDGEQKVNYISTRESLRILDGFGNNSASVMIGKSDYILIYDASRKLVIDGEAYLPTGYLVMKSCNGLQAIDDEDIADVIAALKSRMTMLALGKYRIQAYQLG